MQDFGFSMPMVLDCLCHCYINWNTSYNIQYLRSPY